MSDDHIDVIATTISGSIKDWGKVKRIVPLFHEQGLSNISLHEADTHREARHAACAAIRQGGRTIISAGGSGTFNSVLEGCCDSGTPLREIRLGFLRKGSADLIGKVLGMPDDIESAIRVFVKAISEDRTVPCDVIQASSKGGGSAMRHFVGYGGAEIFGRIPHFTENRFIKYYKGILGQIFGDLGPFTTGMTLALVEKILRAAWTRKSTWTITVDGVPIGKGTYQALILVNGYLGPELPYSSAPLGSGSFYLFALRDLGLRKLPAQASHARDGSILREPERWGMESYTAAQSMLLQPDTPSPFPANVDGSTMRCIGGLELRIVDTIRLLSNDDAAPMAR